jgi:hypothetical protein
MGCPKIENGNSGLDTFSAPRAFATFSFAFGHPSARLSGQMCPKPLRLGHAAVD